MDTSFLKKLWNSIHRELQETWPGLTQADIDYIYGDKERLIEVIQKRERLSPHDAAQEVQDFLEHLSMTRNIA